uniref:Ribosomal protein S3 n=1 Tax=Thraustochytrium aureum TaxID=42467 RepID=Q9G4C6_9STRA|nr:ribosomal protein S3 [Thraustochytrium aureum]
MGQKIYPNSNKKDFSFITPDHLNFMSNKTRAYGFRVQINTVVFNIVNTFIEKNNMILNSFRIEENPFFYGLYATYYEKGSLVVDFYLFVKLLCKYIEFFFLKKPIKIYLISIKPTSNGKFFRSRGLKDIQDVLQILDNFPLHKTLNFFICAQLEKENHHQKIIDTIFQQVKINFQFYTKVKGIKISIKGRVNGSDRSKTHLLELGSIPLNSFNANIFFNFQHVVTAFGVYGVKIYINYSNNFKNETSTKKY